jgi:hypothetical protein
MRLPNPRPLPPVPRLPRYARSGGELGQEGVVAARATEAQRAGRGGGQVQDAREAMARGGRTEEPVLAMQPAGMRNEGRAQGDGMGREGAGAVALRGDEDAARQAGGVKVDLVLDDDGGGKGRRTD